MLTYEELFGDPKDKEDEPLNKTYSSAEELFSMADNIMPPPKREAYLSENLPEQEAQRLSNATAYNNFFKEREIKKSTTQLPDGTYITNRKGAAVSIEDFDEEFNLNDLENPDHFLHDEWMERSNRFLNGLGELGQGASVRKTKDVYEYLRDEKWSTTRTIMRAMQNKQWTPQMMEDYRYIRQVFDKAKLGGTNQILEAVKDIGIDLLVDPMNIVTAAASMFTGGLGGAAVQAGAKGVAAMAGKQALAQSVRTKAQQWAVSPTWKGTMQGMSIGMTEGALDGSLINAATQISERQTGLRQAGDNFSVSELGLTTGLGAIFGGTLGGAVSRVGGAIARRGHAKAMGGKDAELPKWVLDEKTKKRRRTRPEDIKRFRRATYRYNKTIAATLGKATSRYLAAGESASPTLKKFIELIRYDAYKGLLDEGSVDKAVKTSYNIRREMREGRTRVFADKFLSKVIQTGQGMLGTRSFYNIKMDPIANKQLFSLLVGDKDFNLEGLYRRYYNIKPGASKTTMDGELKRHWKRQGRIKLHGQEVAPEVIGAAFHVRRALDNAHTQASFIDVIGKTGKVEGTTSLFNYSKEFVKNYFPRIWIYDALEANRSKLVDLLVKTKHTKLLEGEFPKVKGMLAGRQVDLEFKDGKLQKKNEKGELVNLTAEDQNNIKLVSSFDDTSKKWVIDKNEELDFILTHQEDYDQVTFKTYFKEQGGVKSFIELARNRQPEASEAELGILARRLKGEALVDNMINQKYDLNKVRRDVTSDRTSFSQHRAFSELDDVDLYNLGVIETDVSKVFSDYMHKISSSIERTSLFGNNKVQFAERWQIPIQKELEEAAQKDNPELTRKIIEEITGGPGGVSESSGIMQLYTHVTGIESNYIKNRFAAGVLDGTKVAMRLAYLPLATLSSITEPMIALSRADLADTKPFIKEFSYAAGKQFTKSMNRIFRTAEVGITGKKVTGFKDMSDETWMEFYQAGISAQHAMEDRLQGLYGEYHTNAGRWVSQQFFKYNLLIPWTEAVQMGAYNFSNARITRIIGDLDRGSNFMNQKLSKAAINRRRKELTQIGIQPVEALKAYREHMTPAITIETTTPTGRAWARYDKKANIIYVNESELVKRYQEKAWTKPKIKGVTPLADDQFKSLDEFRSFIYSHERAHVRFVQRRNETKAQYENRTNREALKNPTGSQAHSTLDDSRWKQSNYYDNSVVPSSSLFAREIILNPAVAEANTPLWFNNPGMQLFVQFMGYPTAFNNIVLKGMVRGIRQDPAVNGAKALAATSLMTGTALLTNMLRSHGESLDLEPSEQVAEAYRRWGGMGPLEYAYRWKQAQKYGGYGAAPILKAGTGPLPGKIIDALQYHQTIGEFIGSTVPGWAALSPAQRRKYREFLRARELPDSWQVGLGLRRAIQPTIVGGKARGFAIGGVVDVDNAVEEPDERIDRMTGLPYNVQAGAAFIDAEERKGFANGNLVEKEEIRDLSDKEKARLEVQKNDMYRLLTRDEEEYATLDQTELSMNSKEELEDLEIDQTFYTSLPEDSMKAKLDAYRDSKTLGLKVSERPVDGNVRLSGKIQFQNVLNLNVDEVTPATVEDKLSTIRAGNVLAEPYLADAIIDSIQYQLGVRDAVLEMDDELTKDKEDVVEQSKSFILRHGLLKLGYDAIKYNNGYVLLRENQFMPTEIMSREARNRGGLIGTLEKRRARFAEGGDPKSNVLSRLQKKAYEAWKNNIDMEKRLYIQTLFGDRDKPFTEEDFTEKELLEIASVIAGPAREQLSRFENRHERYDSLMDRSDRRQRSAQNLPELISQFTELSKTDPELAAYREASEGPRKDELFDRLISKHGDLLDTVPDLDDEIDRKKLFNMDEEALNAIPLDKELDRLKAQEEDYRQKASNRLVTAEEYLRTRRGDVRYRDYADEQGPHLGGSPFVSGDDPYESKVGTTLGRFTYDIDPGIVTATDEYDFDQGLYKQYEGLGVIDKALAVANQIREDFSTKTSYHVDKSKPQNVNVTGADYNPIQKIAQVIGEAYIGDEGRPVDIQIPTEGYRNWFPHQDHQPTNARRKSTTARRKPLLAMASSKKLAAGGLIKTLQKRSKYAKGGDPESNEGDDVLLNKLRENAYNRLKIEDREKAERELEFFNAAVVLAESSNTWDATTGIEGNTASGGYQITDDQAITAANRILNTLARMEGTERKEYMESEHVPQWLRDVSLGNLKVLGTDEKGRGLSPTRQQILFEGNMFEAEGSDEVVTPLLRGDRSAMDNFYFDFHHTNPDAEGQGDIRGNWDRALKEIDRQYASLP